MHDRDEDLTDLLTLIDILPELLRFTLVSIAVVCLTGLVVVVFGA